MADLDPSSFTTPGQLAELRIHAGTVKRADRRGTVRKFMAKALTDSVPVSSFSLSMGEFDINIRDDDTSKIARHVFRARIIGGLYGGRDPHSLLDDPCLHLIEGKADSAHTLALIRQHTLVITSKNFRMTGTYQDCINTGDIVQISCTIDRDGVTRADYAVAVKLVKRALYLSADDGGRCWIDLSSLMDSAETISLEEFRPGPAESPEGSSEKCPTMDLEKAKRHFPTITSVKPDKNYGKIGNNNRRYQQPTLGNIKWMHENDGIKYVIRSNGDGEDKKYQWDPQLGACVSKAIEEAFCKSLGIDWHYQSSHDPWHTEKDFVPGKGYFKSGEAALAFFKKGYTLYHCTHGADRTGMHVAYWLKKEGYKYEDNPFRKRSTPPSNDELWRYVTQGTPNGFANIWYPGWLCKGKKSSRFAIAKYIDTFYPMKQFCTSPSNTRGADCYGCKEWNKKYP